MSIILKRSNFVQTLWQLYEYIQMSSSGLVEPCWSSVAVLPLYFACWMTYFWRKCSKCSSCLDVIIWACRALPIYFAGWNNCFDNWNWIFYYTFFQALWSICCDIIMILCNYDNPDLLRLALLPVPTFFTIFFTTFILEGLQKVWNQEVDYFFHIFTGSIFSQYFHLFFHRINLVSQLSYVDTLPRI